MCSPELSWVQTRLTSPPWPRSRSQRGVHTAHRTPNPPPPSDRVGPAVLCCAGVLTRDGDAPAGCCRTPWRGWAQSLARGPAACRRRGPARSRARRLCLKELGARWPWSIGRRRRQGVAQGWQGRCGCPIHPAAGTDSTQWSATRWHGCRRWSGQRARRSACGGRRALAVAIEQGQELPRRCRGAKRGRRHRALALHGRRCRRV